MKNYLVLEEYTNTLKAWTKIREFKLEEMELARAYLKVYREKYKKIGIKHRLVEVIND